MGFPIQLEAERLTETKTWDSTFGDDADCLARSLLENDAIFTKPDYTLIDRVDFMMVIVGAAFETTATSMTNMIYTMWKYPEETEKLRNAIMAHPELSNPETVFTFDMLKNCNELECFIDESMRMHNIVPTMATRYVHEEVGPIHWNSDPLDSINQMVRAKLIVEVLDRIITFHSQLECISVWECIWRSWN